MKSIFQSIALLSISLALFNCSNTNDPTPASSSPASQTAANNLPDSESGNPAAKMILTAQSSFELVKTLTLSQKQGFNLTSPFAITPENGGDIGWSPYGCYAALMPVKVSFNNLKIVAISSITPAYLSTLAFNQSPVANAPAGSTSWTNYMPVKTIIACKTVAGKYILVEVLSDNPLKVNIYHPLRMK